MGWPRSTRWLSTAVTWTSACRTTTPPPGPVTWASTSRASGTHGSPTPSRMLEPWWLAMPSSTRRMLPSPSTSSPSRAPATWFPSTSQSSASASFRMSWTSASKPDAPQRPTLAPSLRRCSPVVRRRLGMQLRRFINAANKASGHRPSPTRRHHPHAPPQLDRRRFFDLNPRHLTPASDSRLESKSLVVGSPAGRGRASQQPGTRQQEEAHFHVPFCSEIVQNQGLCTGGGSYHFTTMRTSELIFESHGGADVFG